MDNLIFSKIGSDFDGTLVSTYHLFLYYINNKLKTNYQPKDYDSYNFAEKLNGKDFEEEMIKIVTGTEEYLGKYKLYSGAKEFINSLKYPLTIITARKNGNPLLNCQGFLNSHFQGLRIIRENHFDKKNILKKLEIKVFFEDRKEIALDIAKQGITVFLKNQPYNQNVQGKRRLTWDNWKSVLLPNS